MPGTYPPAVSGSGAFYPGYVLMGYIGAPGSSGTVVGIPGQAYFAPYAACTLVMMEFSVYSTNSLAAVISFQPYGAPTGGNGTFLSGGVAQSVSVPASGGAVWYSKAQNAALGVGGYAGLGVTVTSGSSTISVAIDCVMFFTQAAQ